MKNIIIGNQKDLKYKYLNSGAFASCYLTKDREVFKSFNHPATKEMYDTITRLSDTQIDSFVTPQTLVFHDSVSRENFDGYLMRYSKGLDFKHIPLSTQMKAFINALCRLERDIKELSERKFQIYDLKGENVLYTKEDKIDVLDMDLYKYDKSLNNSDILKCNLMELEYLIDNYFIKLNPKRFKSSKLLELYDTFSYGRLLGSYYLFEIMKEIEKESKESVETYEDFNKGLSLIMKKY